MKKIVQVLLIMMIAVTACFDDSELQNQIDDLSSRVTSLEQLTKEMNTSITGLQTAVTALQNNDYVTSVAEVTEDDMVIGYTLTFAKSGEATIYHGNDGVSPVVGVKQFDDGIYYWTVDADWVTNDEGEKVKAVGLDGITPKLKIEDGDWYLSVDNETTWTNLGKATGEDGDSFFTSVTQDDDNVYLDLANGTKIILPKNKPFSITFEEPADVTITAGATKTLNYTITGATEKTVVKALAQNNWRATVTPADHASGTITVTAPNPLVEDEIIVLVYDGDSKTIMSSINFITGTITVASEAFSLSHEATTAEVNVDTNIDYEVSIPEEAQDWLSVASLKSASTMRQETITFNVAANEGFYRYAVVSVKNNGGLTLHTIAFEQAGGSTTLHVETPGTLSSLITEGEKNNLKTLAITGTLDEYDFLTIAEMPVLENLDISEITNTTMPAKLFQNNKVIQEVKLPKDLTVIPDYLFDNSSIKKCTFPSKVTHIGSHSFLWSQLTGELNLPSTLISIGNNAFYSCYNLIGELKLPKNIEGIGPGAFSYCNGFTGQLLLPENLEIIEFSVFSGCSGFSGNLIIPENIQNIEGYAFNNCTGIEKVYSKGIVPPETSDGGTNFPNYKYLGVPIGSKSAYENAPDWKDFLVIEEVDFEALGL